jgi:N-acetylglucosaminyl-diphospho-decaprenol L-rhamnosyltransferase
MTLEEPIPPRIDAVIVSYRSTETLRGCVEALAGLPHVTVTVVDNASPGEDPLARVADLPIRRIRAPRNGGFAYGCNLGAREGRAPYVLFLNPDARIADADARALASVLDENPGAGAVGPRILDDEGRLMASQRRFPDMATTWGQALFLHRVIPRTHEMIEDASAYDRPREPDWVSGACMLVRRSALMRIGGMDEGFFLYSEDTDVCAEIRKLGLTVRYAPEATAWHTGGVSAPRNELLAVLAESRVRYVRKHSSPAVAWLETVGIAVGEATHALVRARRAPYARGHLTALLAVLRMRRSHPPRASTVTEAPLLGQQ